jgi:large subunit ribosomal protein L30
MAKKDEKKKQEKMIRIRQVKSVIGTRREHREVVKGLGLRRIRDVVERPDTPAVRGMVAKVRYLVEVEES